MTQSETTALLSESYAVQVQLLDELDAAYDRERRLIRYLDSLHAQQDDQRSPFSILANGACRCAPCKDLAALMRRRAELGLLK